MIPVCHTCGQQRPFGFSYCSLCYKIDQALQRMKAERDHPLITVQLSSVPSVPGAIGTVVPAASGSFATFKGAVVEQKDLDLPCTESTMYRFLGTDQ